jgi:asparagine synthase (glutamine-hydrolysing)
VCGIIGEVVFHNQLIEKDTFVDLRALGYARGPNDQGYETDGRNYQFGFNRLSILDLSSNGHQPMFSPSRSYIVVLNGEIYNR